MALQRKSTLLRMFLIVSTEVSSTISMGGLLCMDFFRNPQRRSRRGGRQLMAYLLVGVPYVLWDNIPRGSQINCQHIERACTTRWWEDRKLGVTEAVMASAVTIHLFTGNNIAPKGDMASRALQVRLDVDRADPE